MPATAMLSVPPLALPLPLSCAPISDHTWGWVQPSITQTEAMIAADIYLVFDILNLFYTYWFLNHGHLLSLVVFAQKAEDGNKVTWVEFTSQAHSYLVHQALALAPTFYLLALVKWVIFTFLLEVINDQGACPLTLFIKTSAPHHHHISKAGPSPSTLPAPPSLGMGLVQDLRPPALILSLPALLLLAAPLMAVDSPLPPPSTLSPLSYTPMPHAVEFNMMVADTPLTPEPPCSSSPSPSASSKALGAMPWVKLGHGKLGGQRLKCHRNLFSPPLLLQDCTSLLVPLGWPGQCYTLDSLVTYKVALHGLWVCTRISIKEEEHTFTVTTSLMSAPHVSLTPPPSTPNIYWPVAPSGTGVPSWHRSAVSLACNIASPSRCHSPYLALQPPSRP